MAGITLLCLVGLNVDWDFPVPLARGVHVTSEDSHHFQTPVIVPLHSPNSRQMPAVRAVQGDCERVMLPGHFAVTQYCFFHKGQLYMVPTGSDASKLRTFPGPFQDQISCYKDIYGEFHNVEKKKKNIPHICGNFRLLAFGTPHLTELEFILYFGGKFPKHEF